MDMFFNKRSALQYYELKLQQCTLSPAIRKRHLVSVLGSDGQDDLMKGLGPPSYELRTLRATFELVATNPWNALDRLSNELEGETAEIILPGDELHYMIGDVHLVAAGAFTGAQVVITASCQPWRYFAEPVVIPAAASEDAQTYIWHNRGRRPAVPQLTVSDSVSVIKDGTPTVYQQGEHLLIDWVIPGGGSVSVAIHGGAFTVSYREAIL